MASELGLRDSLAHLWALSVHIVYGRELPPYFGGADYRDHAGQSPGTIREFHLDLYAREILMHAGSSKAARRSIHYHPHLRALHNALRDYGDQNSGSREELYLTLHRLSLAQMPHFDRADWAYLGRYSLVFRHPRLSSLLETAFGMTAFDYLRLSAALFTVYFHHPQGRPVSDVAPLGLSARLIDACVARMSATATQLRHRMRGNMRHGSSWQYTFNELVSTPLVQLPGSPAGTLFCPRPPLLLKKMMAGSLVDLFKVDPAGYSIAVGQAVDDAVRAVRMEMQGPLPIKPEPYGPKRQRRDGVDWIFADDTACLYVECKAAQITKEARTAETVEDLRNGLRTLASAIAQNAENISDLMDGRTSWDPCGRPGYSLIVTLEDWVVFSPLTAKELRSLTEARLQEKGLSAELLDKYPYTVIALSELPNLLAAVETEGIVNVMQDKVSAQFAGHMFSAFMSDTRRSSGVASSLYKRLGDQLFAQVLETMKEGSGPSRE